MSDHIAVKFITVLLSLFLVAYVGYQAYRNYSDPVKTEVALSYTVQDVKRIKGLMIRNEKIIDQTVDGVISYYNDDGVKVTYGVPIAEIYVNQQEVNNQRRIKTLETEIENLNNVQNLGSNYYLNSETLTKQINETLYSIIDINESRNLLDVDEQKAELLTNLNKKQLATGVVTSFSDKISELELEIEQLESEISGGSQVITAQEVGYFSSYVDNMESRLTPEIVDAITVAELQNYIDARYEQDNTVIGKIIEEDKWYFMTLVPNEDAAVMREGTKLNIDFGVSSYRNVPAEIRSIREEEGASQSVVIITGDYMGPQLTRLRNPSVELNFERYTGLKVPDSAVRFRNDVRGVYVDTGSGYVFKELDVIYEGSGYVLSAIDALDEHKLQLYDEIVVNGIVSESMLEQSSLEEASSDPPAVSSSKAEGSSTDGSSQAEG